MVIAISNARSAAIPNRYKAIAITTAALPACDTILLEPYYDTTTQPYYDTTTAVLQYNYSHTMIQLQLHVLRYNYGRITYRTTSVLRQSYFRTPVQLLLRYDVITLHYVNFVLTPTVPLVHNMIYVAT